MSVFIDAGGNDCAWVKRYMKTLPHFDKVYVFEPNPAFHDSYENAGFELVKKAVWTEDCVRPLYISRDQRQVASSLLEDKLCKVDGRIVPYWHSTAVDVECVDFSKWIQFIEGEITLKLDIEGAEYDVLDKMISDGSIGLIRKLYVEFHKDTVIRMAERHNTLIESLRQNGLEPLPWD